MQPVQHTFDLAKLGLPQVYYLSVNGIADLKDTLPIYDGVQRQFQRPVFGPDGSLEYPRLAADSTPPDDIDGYTRDPNNAWRFTPNWPPCLLRGQGTMLKENGCINVAMACNNPESKHFGKKVSYENCRDCQVRRFKREGDDDQDQLRFQ